MTTFVQLSARLKNFLRGWLLVLGLKEGLVECATVCVKSVVILLHIYTIQYWTSAKLAIFRPQPPSPFYWRNVGMVPYLKYGFCKKPLLKNATLISWTLFSSQKGTTVQSCIIPKLLLTKFILELNNDKNYKENKRSFVLVFVNPNLLASL